MLEDTIKDITERLRRGEYPNETAISQGVVLRVFESLGWPRWDPGIIKPEYTLENRRVDYALCHPANKPVILVEVKRPGHALDGERQLFEYAFHAGVPMVILTDGQEWHFYLPAEQGNYQDRRVYNLNVLERDVSESVKRLQHYLQYQLVASGKAMENARNDYRSIAKKRELERYLPKAWSVLVTEKDELLIELIQEKVEAMCGYQPDFDMVTEFLGQIGNPTSPLVQPLPPHPTAISKSEKQAPKKRKGRYGYELYGQFLPARNACDTMISIFQKMAKDDASFLERFCARKHGKKRRYVARKKMELYPGRSDLCEDHSKEIIPGWWIGTNHSRGTINEIIKLACEVSDFRYGKDIVVYLGHE